MKLYSVLSLVLLAAVRLLSCRLPSDQAFDKIANSSLKTVLLLQVAEPALGAPAPGGEGRDDELDAALRERAHVGKELTLALRAELEHRGFKVQVSDILPRIVSDAGIDTDVQYFYDDIETRADAILHVDLEAGYVDLRPWLYVRARLLSAGSKQQLYFRRLGYGLNVPGDKHIFAPPEHTFPSRDALLQQRLAAAERLQAGARTVAAAIADELR